MGCRSFLTVYRDETGRPKFYGRFNQGVVTINLVDVACSSGGDKDKFWKIFDERLESCHRALLLRHKRLLGTPSDVAPILWQNGALARLEKGEKIDRPDQKVGIITANAQALGEKHFAGAGIEHVPKVVIGLEETFFLDAFNSPDGSYDTDDLQREMENHAEKLVREHPEIGALVFECTNMPPFAAAVQKKTGLPVFDYTTLANYVYSALVRKPFHGFL